MTGDYSHVTYPLSVFIPTKKMGIIKIPFGHYVGKYGPWYYFPVSFVPGSSRYSLALS